MTVKPPPSLQMVFSQQPIDLTGSFFLSSTPSHKRREKTPTKKHKQNPLLKDPIVLPQGIVTKTRLSEFIDSRHISDSEKKARKNKSLNHFR